MRGDNERMRLFTRRAFMVGGLQAGLFTLLAGRLYYLEVMQGETYRTMAEENRINLRLIAPPRGQILDRAGVPVALNEQNYRLVLLPEQIDNLDALLDRLGRFVPIGDSDRKRILRDMRNNDNLNAVLVKDNLGWDQVAQISLHTLDLPGADIDTGSGRSYPYDEAAAHLLGYTGAVSENEKKRAEDDEEDMFAIPGFRIGKNGVEKQYDEVLRGEAGHVQLEVNAHGRVVRELARTDPVSGHELKLTIDIGLQQFAYQRLAIEPSAAAVVMDVETGAVYALVSQPGFDPNLFTGGISQDDWDRLNADEHTPLLNKAIGGVYAPGSTFKPMVAVAALEGNIADPGGTVFCPGHYDLGNHRFHCWKPGGHGHVNMAQALKVSCDTYFYDLGRRCGIDRIQSTARRFGFGQKLDIDLPHERGGLMPGRGWKFATRGELWQQGETLITAIGQGAVATTPLQLATMMARIANGGKPVKPYIVKPAEPQDSTPAFNPKHVAFVRAALGNVVNEQGGTAYAARITEKGMEMGGKTGTAQVRRIAEGERGADVDAVPWKERDHALFIAFAPLDTPKYAIAVVVEHGGHGGSAAAPMARDILRECQTRKIGV